MFIQPGEYKYPLAYPFVVAPGQLNSKETVCVAPLLAMGCIPRFVNLTLEQRLLAALRHRSTDCDAREIQWLVIYSGLASAPACLFSDPSYALFSYAVSSPSELQLLWLVCHSDPIFEQIF
jgi:hypothetical protein